MTEHTQLPWRLENYPFTDGFNCSVLDAELTPIFEIPATPLNAKPGPWTDSQKKMAELIVLAVNHHAELVACLREMRNDFGVKDCYCNEFIAMTGVKCTACKANELLRKLGA